MYKEGKANVSDKNAFVNSEAKLTRDIGVALVNAYAKNGSVLDATAATGLRGIRYLIEGKANNATFLEINKSAYPTLKKNIVSNKVSGIALNESVQRFANTTDERFDVIDIDPFGGISPYIYDLLKVAKDKTLLFATATDTAVVCGAHKDACIRLYDAVPMHNELEHEAGLRILVGYIARVAASFKFGIDPYASFIYKHYMRVHVRISYGASEAMESLSNIGYVGYCNKCMNRNVQQGRIPKEYICNKCGSRMQLGGPLWIGKLQNKDALKKISMYLAKNQIADEGIVDRLYQEPDEPFYFSIPRITKFLGMKSVSPYLVIDELKKKGKKAALAHFNYSFVKTDADIETLEMCIKAASLKLL